MIAISRTPAGSPPAPTQREDPATAEAMDCFAHGLAHLIDALGRDEALIRAAAVVLELEELHTGP